jgi:small subunit ribosomal protein S17
MADTDTTATDRKRVLKQGLVVSDKTSKTRTIRIDRLVKHEKYGKYLRKKTTAYAHDEKDESKAGDMVEIEFCRPLSKTKRWRVTRVVRRKAAVVGKIITGAEAVEPEPAPKSKPEPTPAAGGPEGAGSAP